MYDLSHMFENPVRLPVLPFIHTRTFSGRERGGEGQGSSLQRRCYLLRYHARVGSILRNITAATSCRPGTGVWAPRAPGTTVVPCTGRHCVRSYQCGCTPIYAVHLEDHHTVGCKNPVSEISADIRSFVMLGVFVHLVVHENPVLELTEGLLHN